MGADLGNVLDRIVLAPVTRPTATRRPPADQLDLPRTGDGGTTIALRPPPPEVPWERPRRGSLLPTTSDHILLLRDGYNDNVARAIFTPEAVGTGWGYPGAATSLFSNWTNYFRQISNDNKCCNIFSFSKNFFPQFFSPVVINSYIP